MNILLSFLLYKRTPIWLREAMCPARGDSQGWWWGTVLVSTMQVEGVKASFASPMQASLFLCLFFFSLCKMQMRGWRWSNHHITRRQAWAAVSQAKESQGPGAVMTVQLRNQPNNWPLPFSFYEDISPIWLSQCVGVLSHRKQTNRNP